MGTIIELIKKYKALISYLFFGVCTTVINIAVYYLCYNVSGIPNVPSTVIAWVVAVVFAYITNKLFVFDSKSFKADVLVREMASFFGCRLLTGILDVIIMYVAVDVMDMNSTLWKLVSNVLVIILNYVASKLVIFKKK
ncbi:MAG: GtrA family protein [Bacteroides thetaiotaomicron]|nr:GtrA family protein [Bacteroides thetaiotaomicron]